jgi:putative drug exporter of the RND superfamily
MASAKSPGFTGRLAYRSARHPWLTVLAWVVLLGTGLLISGIFPASLTTDMSMTSEPEAVRGEQLLESRMDNSMPSPDEYVVVDSSHYTVDDPEFQTFVGDLQSRLIAMDDYVEMAPSYYQLGDEMLVSDDRSATIIPVFLHDADADIHPFLKVIDQADGEQGFRVVTGGYASISNTFMETSESDLMIGETIGVSMALIVLVVVFGALVAAGIPLLMALVAILIAVGVTMVVGHVFDLSIFVLNIMVMIGLAVGIDYSLFILGRYREERRQGHDKLSAVVRAGDTASKAVFFSGITVVIALTGMLIVPDTIFKSLGTGAIIVVAVSVLATLTLLPAMIGLLGDRVDTGRRRVLLVAMAGFLVLFAFLFRALDVSSYFVGAYLLLAIITGILAALGIDPFHRRGASESGGFWARVARLVMGRPVASVLLVGTLLIGLSSVYFTIEIGESGISTWPQESSPYRAFTTLSERFSTVSLERPNTIVIDAGDAHSVPVHDSIERLTSILSSDPDFGPATVEFNNGGNLATIRVAAMSDTSSNRALESIERLRSDYIPAAFDGVNAEVLVTGPSALTLDYASQVSHYTRIVFAFVLGMSFLLLLLAFRSVVVPLKSVVMNLLSVGAAYGLLVAVFQHGVGNEIFRFQQVERIDAWIPLMMFTILFGLSMDYHVFLLSRIREHYDETHDNAESVAFGVRTTASMITGAALIMVAVFSGFAMGELVSFQQIGFGLAVAVILDATIIRSVLVPASMRLLGDWNWYLPAWLAWLPKINIEGNPEPVLQSVAVSPEFTPSD